MKKLMILLMILNISIVLAADPDPTPNPPPLPPPLPGCVRDANGFNDYFATVGTVNFVNSRRACVDRDIVGKAAFGQFGAMASFSDPADSAYFKSTMDLNAVSSISKANGFINFLEISKEINTDILPNPKNVILNAIISHDQEARGNNYSLLINYMTNFTKESLIIPLDNPIFDITIVWVNSGCILDFKCEKSSGQIAVLVESENSYTFRLIEELNYKSSVIGSMGTRSTGKIDSYADPKIISPLWKASAIYWGELDNINMNHKMVLSTPTR
jgi:hypothetical protein